MAEENADLFSAFAEDHAFLGTCFHELSQALRAGDLSTARTLAARLDREAGAHIAFEEEQFYPELVGLLGEAEVERMHAEHRDGLEVVQRLCSQGPASEPSEAKRRHLLTLSEGMETHIADCGDLFEAMGRIPPREQELLHAALVEWRLRHPEWRAYAASIGRRRSSAALET